MESKTKALMVLVAAVILFFAAYTLLKPAGVTTTSTTTTSTTTRTTSTTTTTTTLTREQIRCQLIARDCVDETCAYFDLCDEGDLTDCLVYDCQIEYRVNITRADGEKIIKTSPKDGITYNRTQLDEVRERCSGKVEIIEQECVNEELTLKVRVETKGVCEIQAFMANINGEYKALSFKKTGNSYRLTLDSCPEEYRVFAITEGGITIR